MKQLLQRVLARLAKKTLRAYKPKVIAITGSVGKTSTRHAIVAAIGSSRRVRATVENYNNEIGVPLTILNETSPGRSFFGWVGVLWRGWRCSQGGAHDYPEILVLEFGADARGDIQYLCQMARPYIAVVTAVGVAHAEYFGTIEDVKEEKSALIRGLAADGIAILNADDANVSGMSHLAKGSVVTYGLGMADITAEDIRVDMRQNGETLVGDTMSQLMFTLRMGRDSVPVTMKNVIGDAHVRSVLAGAAVALQLGLSPSTIAKNVQSYIPMPGRLRLLPGIKHTLLIDDTYNASPEAVHAALEVLCGVPINAGAQRIAVVGDMLELGRYSEQAHKDVGKHVATLPIDLFVTVGEHARDAARAALEQGMAQTQVYTYANSVDAGRFLQERMKRGDAILVKGSQGIRTEKIVKELMAEPLRAPELLVRQYGKWLAN
ncbi:hypothetical protein COV06_01185 [Candidatus Uhrbacteria bacterium CG10_big_fil_rev_8_21_14_0_10_50_16]|uniref:UDP-N-acetylmuramoyl-tripeptide--D-alanyl-D-alanine ligase n=1 Tax=Candidatus Uhrbacteria bacterium CG10_big_fil_rev_8_21_14_0_10_50_16 TaxID=1975039 RepID=A0A2H0RNI0_9BACT|nr:MAG: hypothetical protein COV06_01185 [Candidatus Uhrbacteria bacterium CG10_big_fil_rev_8_21_14_0_10_50_16]